jgi:hypothetical protein
LKNVTPTTDWDDSNRDSISRISVGASCIKYIRQLMDCKIPENSGTCESQRKSR